jgi:adenylylsulfate kinase
MGEAFAVWLTGLPASGKSSIARELSVCLRRAGLTIQVLESDAVRTVLTPSPTYEPAERDLFYRALAYCASVLVAHGVSVILDATATRRAYRDLARTLIPRFLEVAVECPLSLCQERDYKGTYRRGMEGGSQTVPGLQDPYETPRMPDVVVDTSVSSSQEGVAKIIEALQLRGFLSDARAMS